MYIILIMDNTLKDAIMLGKRVEANITVNDSFYKSVRGIVTRVQANGWVNIQADEVIDKWSETWEMHPTTCATSAKIENTKLI